MTMPYSPGRALFEGNATATDFPFYFKVWGTEQLAVTLTGPDGSSRRLERPSGRQRRQRDLSP